MPTQEIGQIQEQVFSPEVKCNQKKIFISPDGKYINMPNLEIKNDEQVVHCTLDAAGNIDVYSLNQKVEKVKFDYVGSEFQGLIQAEFSDKFEYQLTENRLILGDLRSDKIYELKSNYINAFTGLNLEETNMVAQRLSPITGGSNPELDPDKRRLNRVREAAKKVVESWEGFEDAVRDGTLDAFKVMIGEALKNELRDFPKTIHATANRSLEKDFENNSNNSNSENWKPKIAKADPELIEEMLQRPNIYVSIMPRFENIEQPVFNAAIIEAKTNKSVEQIMADGKRSIELSKILTMSFGLLKKQHKEDVNPQDGLLLELLAQRVNEGLEAPKINSREDALNRINSSAKIVKYITPTLNASEIGSKLLPKVVYYYLNEERYLLSKFPETVGKNELRIEQKSRQPEVNETEKSTNPISKWRAGLKDLPKLPFAIGASIASAVAVGSLFFNPKVEMQTASNYTPENLSGDAKNEQAVNPQASTIQGGVKNSKLIEGNSNIEEINGFELTETRIGVKTIVLKYSEKDLRAVARQTSESGKPNVKTVLELIRAKVDGSFYNLIIQKVKLENKPLKNFVKIKKLDNGTFEIVIQIPKDSTNKSPTIPSKSSDRQSQINKKTVI